MATAATGSKRSFSTMIDDAASSMEWTSSPSLLRPNTPASFNASTRLTPTPTLPPRACRRYFDPNASIALVGVRGTGKSTLAIIASVPWHRRVVDVETRFHEATGFFSAKYRKQFGASNHNLRQEELLRTILQNHDKGAIIVCNSSALERSGQVLLQMFSNTHPVIHIIRDLPSIHSYLEVCELSRLQKLVAFAAPIFRRCSNYEFYNISESKAAESVVPMNQPWVPAFLTLKRAERAFLKFLSLIIPPTASDGVGQEVPISFEPEFPLSEVPVEVRKHTFAVQVPLSDLDPEDVDIEGMEFGSDAFEVVVDPTEIEPRFQQLPTERADHISGAIAKVRRSTVVPVIYHVTFTLERGCTAAYLAHVRHGLRMAPEFATIDLSLDEATLREIINSRGSTKIIGHLHTSVDWLNPFWLEKYDVAVRLGCAVVRFTRPANVIDDDQAIQSLRNKIDESPRAIPLICFNTGYLGRRSACFNQILSSVVPASVRDGPSFQARTENLTVLEATHSLYASFTYDPMKFYIVGAHAGYSLPPAMHNAAYKACGMPHRCTTVQTSTLKTLQELVQDPNFGGTAITQPFQLEVISLVHSMSRHARAIGAVDTLIPVRHINEDGSIPSNVDLFKERNQAGPVKALYGDNTDWIGIKSCIRRGLSPANAVRSSTCGLVVGAGGMARAAVYAMLQLGVKRIAIYNRTVAHAEKLVSHFDRLVATSADTGHTGLLPVDGQTPKPTFHVLFSRDESWPADLRPPTIILSCIPRRTAGDSPAPELTVPPQWMHSLTGGVVVELAYGTSHMPLMKQVREGKSGAWVCLDGMDLLPAQGFAQFELFTSKRAPRRVMREEVLRSRIDEQQGQSDPAMVQMRLNAIDGQEE